MIHQLSHPRKLSTKRFFKGYQDDHKNYRNSHIQEKKVLSQIKPEMTDWVGEGSGTPKTADMGDMSKKLPEYTNLFSPHKSTAMYLNFNIT